MSLGENQKKRRGENGGTKKLIRLRALTSSCNNEKVDQHPHSPEVLGSPRRHNQSIIAGGARASFQKSWSRRTYNNVIVLTLTRTSVKSLQERPKKEPGEHGLLPYSSFNGGVEGGGRTGSGNWLESDASWQ